MYDCIKSNDHKTQPFNIMFFFTHCIIKVNPNGINNEFFTGAKPSICSPNGHENRF